MTDLTRRVLEYRKCGKESPELMDGIVREIFKKTEIHGIRNKDFAREILGDFYPALPGLIERFNDGEAGFEPYLKASLRYFRKSSYLKNKRIRERMRAYRDRVGLDAAQEAVEAAEDETSLDAEDGAHSATAGRLAELHCADPGRGKSLESAGKRLLYLCLKCCFSMGNRQMEDCGEKLGLGKGHFQSLAESLKSLAHRRIERLDGYRSVRDGIYGQLILTERLLRGEYEEEKARILAEKAAALRSRFYNCQEKIRRSRAMPSNEEIALVLGIPKGTVDSGLHYFKRMHSYPLRPPEDRACLSGASTVSSVHADTICEREPAQDGGDDGPLSRA